MIRPSREARTGLGISREPARSPLQGRAPDRPRPPPWAGFLALVLTVAAVAPALSDEVPFPGGAACRLDGRTIPDGARITGYHAPAVPPGEACAGESRLCVQGSLSGTAPFADCLARSRAISRGYRPPASKQGVHDFRYDDPPEIQAARYAAFARMGLGYKEYNLFWRGLESGVVPSSPEPIACPEGTFQVPADAAERAAWGFHRYRCLSSAQVAVFDRQIARDAEAGMQSGAVLWAAPERYRDPGCLGSPFGGALLRDGCIPRADALDDFEDYVAFVANRWSGRNGRGKISHFIVWNEAASAVFFDASPRVATRGRPSPEDAARWTALYAELVARAHAAIQRNTVGVMLYASTDLHWQAPRPSPDAPAHIGTRTLIDGLWRHLGAGMAWSVAVHPYGDPVRAPPEGTYGFANLDMVVEHQRARLRALGLPETSLDHPQAYLIASEQGWPQSIGIDRQARAVCRVHAHALQVPTLLAQAHNYFQSVEPQEATAGTSNQGAFFGLVPYAAPLDLSTLADYPTGAAYLATAPATWARTSAHLCCREAGVGCRTPPGTAPVYRAHDGGGDLFTRDLAEGPRAGLAFEGTAFAIFADGGAGRAPLYRCRNGRRFLSREAACEGGSPDGGLLGYVATAGAPDLVPLLRDPDPATGAHRIARAGEAGTGEPAGTVTLGYVPAP